MSNGFQLGREPISKVRRPPLRMPLWVVVLFCVLCLCLGILLGVLLS